MFARLGLLTGGGLLGLLARPDSQSRGMRVQGAVAFLLLGWVLLA